MNPLVSIIVITYNSSKYILETLESANEQTYQNVELIISDDCSTDNTAEICKRWIEENKNRFVRTELVSTSSNSGIPSNCNRGIQKAQGIWYKLIAGDDILLPDALRQLINYVRESPEIQVIVSQVQPFMVQNNQLLKVGAPIPDFDTTNFYSKPGNSISQLNQLLNFDYSIAAPGIFMKAEVFKQVCGYNESYKSIEDLPMWLKLLSKGYYLYPFMQVTVWYRRHESAVSVKKENILPGYINELNQIYRNEFYPIIPWYLKLDYFNMFFFSRCILAFGNKGIIAKIIHRYSKYFRVGLFMKRCVKLNTRLAINKYSCNLTGE